MMNRMHERPIRSGDGDNATGLTTSSDSPDQLIATVLRMIRKRFNLDVSFISQVKDGRRTFRFVDADDGDTIVRAGASDPVDDSYCGHVLDGSLPEFLLDPAQHPVSAAMPATREVPVGTHLSVPITFSDGAVYGTLCSFGYDVHNELGQRDLEVLHTLASMIAGYVEDAEVRRQAQDIRAADFLNMRVDHDLLMVFQPIVDVTNRHIVGVEALARFPSLGTGPAEVFEEAWRLGVGLDLELRAAGAALRHLPKVTNAWYMAVNLSSATVASDKFLELSELIDLKHPERIVVEITEHAAVQDYPVLKEASRKLRELGVRFAIDDVGTGYSGLDHMLRIAPDMLKLDGALIQGIDASDSKQAMVAALQTYASRMDTTMIAERVETQTEHDALRILGIDYGQGYLYAKPAPITTFERPAVFA